MEMEVITHPLPPLISWSQRLIRFQSMYFPQKSYFYYKVVNCSRIPEIEQELDTLIPGNQSYINFFSVDLSPHIMKFATSQTLVNKLQNIFRPSLNKLMYVIEKFKMTFFLSISGVLGKEVANRLGKEMKHRRLNDMGQCKVGFEILFKETELRKRTRRSKTTVQCTVKYESNDDKDDDGGWFWSRRRR